MALEHFKTQVLLLHSQQSTLDALSAGFGDRYAVHVATSGAEALNTLGATPIHVLVSAQDLPGMSGLEALREARKRSPDTIGILLAGNDRDDGLEALVGDQEVFQIVRGAISPEALRNLIDTATKRIRLLAISESANDQAADVDEPVGEHIVMETGEHGRSIISGSTGAIPVLQPQKTPVSPNAGGREVDVLVLTKDEEFLTTIRESSRGLHNVHHANTLAQAEAAVREHKIGVLVTDAAMAGSGIEGVTQRLRADVPRLVAIVAGRRDDGEMLMDLINRGHVYRFLLKPVSPGRARLAVEASIKHHLEAADSAFTGKKRGAQPAPQKPAQRRTAAKTVPAARRARTAAPERKQEPANESGRLTDSGARRSPAAPPESAAAPAKGEGGGRAALHPGILSAVAAVVLLGGGGAWWWLQSPSGETPEGEAPAGEPVVESAPSIVETEIPAAAVNRTPPPWQGILDEARSARDAGELIAPPESNAIELYLAARAMAPDDPVIATELDAVIEQVLALAETALLEERTEAASAALRMVRLANPQHPRLPFLDAQVRQLELRARLNEARLAIREQRFEDAAIALAAAEGLAGDDTAEVEVLTEELAAARSAQQVDEVLALANARLAEDRLVEPSNNNARYYYELVLSNDRRNTAARQGLMAVASKLVLRARTAVDEGRLDEAESLLQDVRELDPSSSELAATAEALATARTAAEEAARQTELAARAAAEAERQAAAAEAASPQGAGFAPTSGGTPTEVAGGATGDTALAAGSGADEVSAAGAEPSLPDYVPISSLTRTSYVVPEYPRSAQRRNITGWVDVTFTVTAQGTVEDISIMNADPGDVFNEAAMEAIEEWRFEPPVENDMPVPKRVAVRLSFDLQ